MRLHLGCGQKYIEGYLNIDYPDSYQSVQKSRRVDEYHDIRQLSYEPGSIEEIRLHHVFEHFPRPVGAALVAGWNTWLQHKGKLRIEVPDFTRTARAALSCFSTQRSKKIALRHLYGSNEAEWAVHYEGYSAWLLKSLVETFGYTVLRLSRNSWRGTSNVEITAEKDEVLDEQPASARAHVYLEGFLVSIDDERPLLDVWMQTFRDQYAKSTSLRRQ